MIFSCTKAIISSAIWILIGEGKLKVSEKVAEIIPEFATNGKDTMTVEQVMLHVGGFPNAPYPQHDWGDRNKRLERFKSWRLEWPVGEPIHVSPDFGILGAGGNYRTSQRKRISPVRARTHREAAGPRRS